MEYGSKQISIHLMCRFNVLIILSVSVRIFISIHLMCRFNLINFINKNISVSKFQYISCVGSILKKESQELFQSISIHLMCRFNASSHTFRGSPFIHFNTSHVSVQQSIQIKILRVGRYFNTSHVSVQLVEDEFTYFNDSNFNTSHVSVQ